MRCLSNGPITTLLLLVPIILVPLLAVFGVPQFEPIAASRSSDEQQNTWNLETDVGESARYSLDDLFAPIQDDSSGTGHASPNDPNNVGFTDTWRDPFLPQETTFDTGLGDRFGSTSPENALKQPPRPRREPNASQQTSIRWIPPDQAREGWALDLNPSTMGRPAHARPDDRNVVDSAERMETGSGQFDVSLSDRTVKRSLGNGRGSAHPPQKPLTWRSAVDRLNELGIRHFQLEPGERADEFHFSCFFTPNDNPRVTIRFEAESTEPLRAVQKVLAQIETWSRQRDP